VTNAQQKHGGLNHSGCGAIWQATTSTQQQPRAPEEDLLLSNENTNRENSIKIQTVKA
jgi:hypothetical protein